MTNAFILIDYACTKKGNIYLFIDWKIGWQNIHKKLNTFNKVHKSSQVWLDAAINEVFKQEGAFAWKAPEKKVWRRKYFTCFIQ